MFTENKNTKENKVTKNYRSVINYVWYLSKIFIQFSITIGIIITLIYCGTIGYFPRGLTIGDTFLFIAASLSFAMTYTLITVALLIAGITVSIFLRWLQPPILFTINLFLKKLDKPPSRFRVNFPNLTIDYIAIAIFGVFMLILNIIAYYSDAARAFSLTCAIILMGFFWGLFNTKPRRKEYNFNKERRLKISLVIFSFFIPLLVIEKSGGFLNQSMELIGVRVESTTIQLDKQYTEYLKKNDILPTYLSESGEGVYKGVTILFQGVGTEVSIAINDFSTAIPSDKIMIGKLLKNIE